MASNLIFVFADQLRYQSCGYTGDENAHTPNIDKFAGESVNFDNAVSVFPLCGPYRASLFTGKYPSSTGSIDNGIRCRPDPDAIGHVIKKAGYTTGYIGKWHLYGKHHDEQYTPPGPYRLGFDDYWAAYDWNHDYFNGFYYENGPERKKMTGYQTDFQTDLAINYLKGQSAEKPFALFLSYEVPHPPYTWDNCKVEYRRMFEKVNFPQPPNYFDDPFALWETKFDNKWWKDNWSPAEKRNEYLQTYYAMTATLDYNFGRLLDAVDELSLRDNTIIVFTSDHGEMFGAQGRLQKRSFFEESARVPLLVRHCEKLPEGRVCDCCINTPDIMPTLLDMMDIEMPASVEGVSFADAAAGITQKEPESAFMQGMVESNYFKEEEWRAIRDKRYTYALMRKGNREFLFDNKADPYQMNNLAKDESHADLLEQYRSSLYKRMKEIGDTFESTEWYHQNWVEDKEVVRSAQNKEEKTYAK